MNLTLSETAELWDSVLGSFRETTDSKIYDAFFRNTKIGKIDGANFYIVCETELTKTILTDKYKKDVEIELDRKTLSDCNAVFVTQEELTRFSKNSSTPVEEIEIEYFKNSIIQPNLTFNNFVVGQSNREAQKASLIVSQNPGLMFQTLFLYGGSGLGKTHLLNAIGNEIKRISPEKKVLYCSAQDFVNEYIDFVRDDSGSKDKLNKYLKKFDVFLIDDIQMLKDKRRTQEFFFNIYEDFRQNHKQFVVTSDKLPGDLDGIDTRIITRFTSGLAVPIHKPDTETCAAILREKIATGDFEIKNFDEEVIYFLADKFRDSIRGLEGALIRLNFYASFNKVSKIDIDFCTEALQGMIDVSDAHKKVNVQKILNVVSSYYGLTISQITGKVKQEKYVNARNVAIYLIRDILDLPFKKIGEVFSNRDHATIMHSIKKVEELLKTDNQVKVVITELKKRLES